jgi:hypothetical protein
MEGVEMRNFINRLFLSLLSRIPYVQKLESDLKKALVGDLTIVSMHMVDGKLDTAFKTKIQMILAEWAFAMLNDFPDAENYIEIIFMDRDKPEFAGTIRIQKHSGKSPHELRLIAEAERDALIEEFKELKGL